MKAITCISGPSDERDPAQELDEARLGSRARRGHRSTAKYVSEAEALSHVAGYCIVNDVSERSFQMATTQWDKGKGFDTAGPDRTLARHHRRDHRPAGPRHGA